MSTGFRFNRAQPGPRDPMLDDDQAGRVCKPLFARLDQPALDEPVEGRLLDLVAGQRIEGRAGWAAREYRSGRDLLRLSFPPSCGRGSSRAPEPGTRQDHEGMAPVTASAVERKSVVTLLLVPFLADGAPKLFYVCLLHFPGIFGHCAAHYSAAWRSAALVWK